MSAAERTKWSEQELQKILEADVPFSDDDEVIFKKARNDQNSFLMVGSVLNLPPVCVKSAGWPWRGG